jgi:hypothetical protein
MRVDHKLSRDLDKGVAETVVAMLSRQNKAHKRLASPTSAVQLIWSTFSVDFSADPTCPAASKFSGPQLFFCVILKHSFLHLRYFSPSPESRHPSCRLETVSRQIHVKSQYLLNPLIMLLQESPVLQAQISGRQESNW